MMPKRKALLELAKGVEPNLGLIVLDGHISAIISYLHANLVLSTCKLDLEIQELIMI